MNIDMHCHLQVYKKQKFTEERLLKIARAAKKNNVDAIITTEHYNSKQLLKIMNLIQKKGKKVGDAFLIEDTLFFPGMEVNIIGDGHIVVMGNMDKILSLRKFYPEKIKKKDSLSLEALLRVCKKYDLKCTGAHPFRPQNPLKDRNYETLKKLNYLEYNGRDVDRRKETYELARKLGLRVVCGSDTHHLLQMGGIYMNLNKRVTTYTELFKEIDAGNYSIEVSKNIRIKNKSGLLMKKIVKGYEKRFKK